MMHMPIGIRNEGNRCYQICIEQSLRSIEKHFRTQIPRTTLEKYRNPREQHDAHEFLMHALESFETWQHYKKFFEGRFTSEITYSCGHSSESQVPCTVLSVPLYKTLEDMILSLESKDEVESVCDTCKVKRNAEKNMYVSSLGYVCIFHLIRFDHSGFKRNDDVDIPFSWNFLRDEGRYVCKAFVVHIGVVSGGHYICFVCYGDSWYCCNDNQITQVRDIEEEIKKAYILFYVLDKQKN